MSRRDSYRRHGLVPKKVLMILAKRNESVKIFRLIKSIDPKAFISQSNVVGVYGEGFDKIKA